MTTCRGRSSASWRTSLHDALSPREPRRRRTPLCAAVPFIREAVAEARPGAAVATVATMDARLSSAVAQPRLYAVLVGGFATVAFLLVALGIYGLLSYTVAQRRGGDRRPHGSRRRPRRCPRAGRQAGRRSRGRRRRRRLRRRGGVEPRPGQLRLRHRHRRPADLRGGAARARWPRRSSRATSRRAARPASSRWRSCASSNPVRERPSAGGSLRRHPRGPTGPGRPRRPCGASDSSAEHGEGSVPFAA